MKKIISNPIVLFSITVFFVLGIFIGSFTFSYAQSFASPGFSAPKNDELNRLENLTSFVRLNVTEPQSGIGSFFIGSSQITAAHISSSTYAIGVVGSSGAAYPPDPFSLGITDAGVYGYARVLRFLVIPVKDLKLLLNLPDESFCFP